MNLTLEKIQQRLMSSDDLKTPLYIADRTKDHQHGKETRETTIIMETKKLSSFKNKRRIREKLPTKITRSSLWRITVAPRRSSGITESFRRIPGSI